MRLGHGLGQDFMLVLPGLRGWTTNAHRRGGGAKHRTSTPQAAKGWLLKVNKEAALVQMGIRRHIGHSRPWCRRDATALQFLRQGPAIKARRKLLEWRYHQLWVFVAVVRISQGGILEP